MERRQFVGLVTTGLTVGIAGCSSGDTNGSGNGGELTDTTTDTPTDNPTESSTETAEPAAFEVERYGIPETVEIGEEVTIKITVRNTGEQVGDFTAPIYARTPESDWQEGGDWTFTDVSPGETVTGESDEPVTFNYINRYEYRLGQSSKTAAVQTVSAKTPWGEEYTTPAGYRIRVDTPTLQDTYEYEDYSGNIVEKEPENGGQWAFVNAWVKNETGQTNYSPLGNDFGLLHGNSQADGETFLVDDPINKEQPFEGGELQPNIERSGWIAYQLPGDVGVNDLTMAWSKETYNGQIAVNWGDD